MLLVLFSVLTAFFIGIILTPLLIFLIKKGNLLDKPGGRKIHKYSVPSMGGIAIFIGLLGGILIWLNYLQLVEIRFFLLGLSIMFILGLRDDLVELTAYQKLIGQLIAVITVVVLGDVRVSNFYGLMGVYELPLWFSYSLTIFAIIGLTNAFNLIDGLDGLAGTLSIITFLGLGGWFLYSGHTTYGFIAFTFVGAVLSFLVYNWHPAKIFMGDTGSLTLGFALSVLCIKFIESNVAIPADSFKFHAPLATAAALLIVPFYDTLRVFVKRARKGISPMTADKSHVHHFLMRMGFRHDQVAIILGAVKIGFIVLMVVFNELPDIVMLPTLMVLVVAGGVVLDRLTLRRVKQIVRCSPRVLAQRSYHGMRAKVKIDEKVLRQEDVNLN
ncbi:glycosyltransferase family 4 protein [Echinicola vietnamensis]|uniref:UDP-N-acetylmuramyl pentapeptide phosphotransferase/UDP-N-acetylglucosamine-1-phosphate transferase n=1 Tax=Echinicola vietnamensis (strain DSM 17526 / LMG 23754 / KMM 6221) TaxID=926556 RepID=L0FUL1_ECHVK|nr:UDP-N-acetylmuramyl pentapeptide phosphotransferase/UDP-N-acetylglucosamine-1-phosphate transferase [Echinicola vietnamensis DSM 17526]